MNKTCLIRQPAGLGDILFLQKVGHVMKNNGYDVVWPVIPEYGWIGDYIPHFKFPTINDEFPFKNLYSSIQVIDNDEVLVLPIQDADRMFNLKIMACKYALTNLDYSDWDTYLTFNRNEIKENELFTEVLGLKEGEEYTFVSRNYGSPPHSEKYPMSIETSLRIVEMDYQEGFTLFDWCRVIENASEMYLIDSSINYIIDKLDMKCDDIHLWSRRPNNWSEIDYIFKTPYRLRN